MLSPLHLWIFFCAAVAGGSWGLSSIKQLNAAGYGLLLAVLAVGLVFLARRVPSRLAFRPKVWKRRFRRPAPMLFLLLACIAGIGGAIHTPYHYDGFAYRLPRVLHWLHEQHWHWIHSADYRLNVMAVGFEWQSAMLIALSKSFRLIFLTNWIAFLLFPGAVFLALSRLGVKKRVAWWWMWIAPAGYCFAFQAGSIATDFFGANFTLCAIGFALRCQRTHSKIDFWASFMAIAFATCAKPSNLPLGLPWLIAIAPSWRIFVQQPIVSLIMTLWALTASAIPIILANLYHGFHWSGFGRGRDYAPDSPIWGVIGNSFWLTVSNLMPPVFPWSAQWNAMMARFLESPYGAPFRSFEFFGFTWRAASEQFSGLGAPVFGLLLITWLWSRLRRRGDRRETNPQPKGPTKWVRVAIWISFFVLISRVGINQIPRYIAPYYFLLAPSLLLAPALPAVIRTRTWRLAALGVIASTLLLVIVSRQRPVFPVTTMSQILQDQFPNQAIAQKVLRTFGFSESLRSGINPLLAAIPPEEKLIGYATRSGASEPWLWLPLWNRHVRRINNGDEPAQARAAGIRYAIVDSTALQGYYDPVLVMEIPSRRSRKMTIEEWTEEYNAEVVTALALEIHPESPAEKAYLVRLRDWPSGTAGLQD